MHLATHAYIRLYANQCSLVSKLCSKRKIPSAITFEFLQKNLRLIRICRIIKGNAEVCNARIFDKCVNRIFDLLKVRVSFKKKR